MNTAQSPKKILLIGIIIGLLTGGVSAWLISNFAANTNPKKENLTAQETQSKQPKPHTGVDDISPAEMYYNLENAKTKQEFDRLYVSYQMQIIVNELGMNRLARDKAYHDEIKQYANQLTATNSDLRVKLRGWESAWGYTHH